MKGEIMNEDLINLDDCVIVTENGETIGELPENPEMVTEDDVRIRVIVKQAFNEAMSEVKKENPYAGATFLLAEFESVFLTKCYQYLSSEEEYAAVERWWIAFRDVTLRDVTLFTD